MDWYYAVDNQQQGPVDEPEMHRLLASGIITPDTFIWSAGMADWQPLSTVPQFQPEAPPIPEPPAPPRGMPAPPTGMLHDQSTPQIACVECGRIFGDEDLIRIDDHPVCGGCKPRAVAKIREGIRIGHRYYPAFLSKRIGAYILDAIILYFVSSALQGGLTLLLNFVGASPIWSVAISVCISIVVSILYFIVFWKKFGATPGKMALGIKIVASDGEPLTWKKAIIRYLGTIVSQTILYIGYLMAFLDEDRRALHDRMASTLVVQRS